MNSTLWKSAIVAVIVVLSHCVNDPPSTLHPVFSINEEWLTDTTALMTFSTANAEEHSLYKIVDDTCMLKVTYYAFIGGVPSTYDSIIPIPNDSAALVKGTFHSEWKAEFSNVKIGDYKKIKVDTLQIFGCVTDQTGHEVCGSLMLLGDTTSVK